MSTPALRQTKLLILVLSSMSAFGGCGAFQVDGGLYPLPAIHVVYPRPSDVGLASEDVQMTAGNGQTLYAWFIPAHEPRATVLFHHGAIANRSSCLKHARLLHELGCNVLLYDYQGFGESWSLATLDTILSDADRALAHLQERGQTGALPIVMFGASLGTLPTYAQSARGPAGVVGVIGEGSCVPQALPRWLFPVLGIAPSPEAFLNVPAALDPLTNVPLITLPKLFLHSPTDPQTPIAGAQELFAVAVEPKEFREVAGGHLDAVAVDPNYATLISGFLDEVVGPMSP